MEETEDLFSLRARDGTYFWDIVRRELFLSLHTMHGGPFVDAPPLPARSLFTDAKDVAKRLINRFTRHYLEMQAPRYIFITGQRIRQHGHLIDNISDHLYDLVSEDAVAVELMNKGAISYPKMLFGKKTRVPPVAVRRNAFETRNDLPEMAEAISSVVNRYFDVSPDIHRLILGPMLTFWEGENFYLQLFAQHRPRAVVCINNGTLYGLFHAGKKMQVPVIELQHGGSNYQTIFWSYPKSISSSHPGLMLPTAYLTFSEFWNSNTYLPVRLMRSIGNDYFHQTPVVGDENGLLIVSSYMYHDMLLSVALELSDRAKERKIYYKLHPHQFAQKAAVVAACAGRSNIAIVSDEMDFPELFALCDYVVGVHSTVLYFALQAGKKVCVYKRSNYFWHDDILGYVELFDVVSDLCEILNSPPGKYFRNVGNLPELFKRFDARRFLQTLDDVSAVA